MYDAERKKESENLFEEGEEKPTIKIEIIKTNCPVGLFYLNSFL